jgi:hypothetical protein
MASLKATPVSPAGPRWRHRGIPRERYAFHEQDRSKPYQFKCLDRVAGAGESLPYEFKGYTLHSKEVKNVVTGKKQTIYFFAKGISKSGTPCDLPKGRKAVLGKNGVLPVLKKA